MSSFARALRRSARASLLAAALVPLHAQARDWVVCKEMAETAECTHTDIQTAIDYAGDRDTILIRGGRFPGALVVKDKNLSIEGGRGGDSFVVLASEHAALTCENSARSDVNIRLTIDGLATVSGDDTSSRLITVLNRGCTFTGSIEEVGEPEIVPSSAEAESDPTATVLSQ